MISTAGKKQCRDMYYHVTSVHNVLVRGRDFVTVTLQSCTCTLYIPHKI